MAIRVVALLYSPDGGPSAPLFGMLCEGLALRGHEVTVIAAVPHYPSGRVQNSFRQWGIKRTHERGVHVVGVPVVVNTSFNENEPLVCTQEEELRRGKTPDFTGVWNIIEAHAKINHNEETV